MDPLNLPRADIPVEKRGNKVFIFDKIRRKWVILTPEEWVRQHMIYYLVHYKHYPQTLIQIEKEMHWNRMRLRSDILISSPQGKPLMLVECKAPEVPLTNSAFEQIARYNQRYSVPFLLVTNGRKHYCCKMDYRNKNYQFLPDIPDYDHLET